MGLRMGSFLLEARELRMFSQDKWCVDTKTKELDAEEAEASLSTAGTEIVPVLCMRGLAHRKHPGHAGCHHHHHPFARVGAGTSLTPDWDCDFSWPILSPPFCPSQVVLPSYEEAVSLPPKTLEAGPAPPPYSEV